jgi:hypothetical protein
MKFPEDSETYKYVAVESIASPNGLLNEAKVPIPSTLEYELVLPARVETALFDKSNRRMRWFPFSAKYRQFRLESSTSDRRLYIEVALSTMLPTPPPYTIEVIPVKTKGGVETEK